MSPLSMSIGSDAEQEGGVDRHIPQYLKDNKLYLFNAFDGRQLNKGHLSGNNSTAKFYEHSSILGHKSGCSFQYCLKLSMREMVDKFLFGI